MTDANVMVGKVQPRSSQRVSARMPTSRSTPVVAAEFDELAPGDGARVRQLVGGVAEGFIDIAVSSMAGAIKKISVARGHDAITPRCSASAAPAVSTPAASPTRWA